MAEERKRNLLYIEKAKQEFIQEIIEMGVKVSKFETIQTGLSSIQQKQKEI